MRNRQNKTLVEQAADYVETAVEKAGPILADAKDKAGPALADARDKAAPLIAQGAAIAAEKASQAADLAAEKAAQGQELVSAKAAEVSDEPKKKKHRLRKLLIFTAIAAALGFVVRKLRASADEENWQSSYTPEPAPAADAGGADPGEAAADAAEEPHEVTTPDQPADAVDVAPEDESGQESDETKPAKS